MTSAQPEPRPAAIAPLVEPRARMEPFDSFWEGPADVERGFRTFPVFYRENYLPHLPADRDARILVVSCGPGYFVETLGQAGYCAVQGIDSDAQKVAHARQHGLDCRVERAFPFLAARSEAFDVIVCEQELNHLTKDEMLDFLALCYRALVPGGTLVVHGLNGANPITGSESLAQNFDHYNTFTEYSLRQVLEYSAFDPVKVMPLQLYVFHRNPFNWIARGVAGLLGLGFRAAFILYGKSNRIFTKKIAAVAQRPG